MDNLYLSGLSLGTQKGSHEEAIAATAEVIQFAAERGFTVLDATVNRSREREPVETYQFASSAPWMNGKAREEQGMETGAAA